PDVLPPALEPLALQPLGAGDRVGLEWTGPVTVLLAVVAVPALVLGPHVAGTRDVVLADVHVHPLAAAWTPQVGVDDGHHGAPSAPPIVISAFRALAQV